jgi:hypothetical protein
VKQCSLGTMLSLMGCRIIEELVLLSKGHVYILFHSMAVLKDIIIPQIENTIPTNQYPN